MKKNQHVGHVLAGFTVFFEKFVSTALHEQTVPLLLPVYCIFSFVPAFHEIGASKNPVSFWISARNPVPKNITVSCLATFFC